MLHLASSRRSSSSHEPSPRRSTSSSSRRRLRKIDRAKKRRINNRKKQDILEKAAELQPMEVLEKWADNIIDKKLGRSKKSDEESRVDYANMVSIEVREPTIIDTAIPQKEIPWGSPGAQSEGQRQRQTTHEGPRQKRPSEEHMDGERRRRKRNGRQRINERKMEMDREGSQSQSHERTWEDRQRKRDEEWRKRTSEKRRQRKERRDVEVMTGLRRLTTNMSMKDAAWLSRGDELLQTMYLVEDRTTKDPSGVPWPVLLTFGTRSRKHLFRTHKCIDPSFIRSATEHLCRRVHWWWHFIENRSEGNGTRPLIKRPPNKVRGLVPPEVRDFCNMLREEIDIHLKLTNKKISAVGRRASNVPSFVRWALRWRREHHFVVSQSDKDGVFVIMNEAELASIKNDQFQKHFYTRIAEQQIDVERKHAREHADALIKRMRKAGWHSWASDCQMCLDKPENGIMFGSGATIKTHKLVGEVACRLIHTSTRHAFSGLSAVADKLAAECIAREAHMAFSTADVIRHLQSNTYPSSCCFAKIVTKDFYMSGKHDTILTLRCQATDEEHTDFMSSLLTCLLHYQFVWDSESKQDYRVVPGTGIGSRHSGSISDLVFYLLAERDLIEKGGCSPTCAFGMTSWRSSSPRSSAGIS